MKGNACVAGCAPSHTCATHAQSHTQPHTCPPHTQPHMCARQALACSTPMMRSCWPDSIAGRREVSWGCSSLPNLEQGGGEAGQGRVGV